MNFETQFGHSEAADWIYRDLAELFDPPADATAARAAEPAQRVFLVATGELHEGEETYTRYEGSPPPLCDFELLWTEPPTGTSKEGGEKP